MTPALTMFVEELRADPVWSRLAQQMDAAFRQAEGAGVTDKDARAFVKVIAWIVSQSRPLGERVDRLCRVYEHLRDRPNCVTLIRDLRAFCGWQEPAAVAGDVEDLFGQC